MLGKAWALIKDAGEGFVNDEALSRGAAIAYYTIFSIAPLLVIAIAIAGFVFGDEAASGAVTEQLRGMMGQEAADAVQGAIRSASNRSSGTIATIIGIVTLLLTASGTFGELQSALNAIWKVEKKPDEEGGAVATVSKLVKAKAAAIGLVAATGFMLIVALVASAAISAIGTWVQGLLPGIEFLLQVVNFLVSFALVTAMFAAIYKVLPDRRLEWRDVLVGAAVTALLFTIGKTVIGLYIGSSAVASSFGAAGAIIVVLVWIYYSAQIFLLGAEFTRAFANTHGSRQDAQVPASAAGPRDVARGDAEPAKVREPPRKELRPVHLGPVQQALATVATVVMAVRELRR